MSSTMHVVALIDQKSKQNGIDFGIGRYRCEENQFGTFRFKILHSAKLTKYYQPFSEGDVVNLVGKFSYETVDRVEGLTINISVATPYPKPPSGRWEVEEIPLSSPYLSFVTQPIPGSLRQIENSQFVRTKSTVDSNFSRSSDLRFRIGYQTDNDRFDNITTSWDAYTQFFVSGFFLHAENSELHVEATELDFDLSSRRSTKNLIQASPTSYAVAGVSPLAKNLSRLLEQEKITPIAPRLPTEHPFAKPNNVRNSNPSTPAIVKNSNSGAQHQQYNNPPTAQDDSLQQDFLKGIQAYQQIMQRFNTKNASVTHPPPPPLMFSPLGNHQVPNQFLEQQPSAEQIAELIGDQGMHQDNAGAFNPKIPSINVWQLPPQQDFAQQQQMENDRNPPVQVSSRQRARESLPSMQAIQHLPGEQTDDHKSLPQQQRSRKKDKGKVPKAPSQNDHEQIAQPQQEVTTPQQDSESGESQDLHSSGKRTRNRKVVSGDKLKPHQSVTRATLGNRFLFYEPKPQEDSNNTNEANNAGSGSNVGSGGVTNVIPTTSLKRGRKSKELTTAGQRAAKKPRNVKKSNNEGDDVASKEDGNEASNPNTPAVSADIGSLEGNEGNENTG